MYYHPSTLYQILRYAKTFGAFISETTTRPNPVATLSGSQTLTNKTFTAPTLSTFTFTGAQTGLQIGTGDIIFEGSSDDAHETTLTAQAQAKDVTITIPDATMTLITTAQFATRGSHITNVIALG